MYPSLPPRKRRKKSRARVTLVLPNHSHRICQLLPPPFFLKILPESIFTYINIPAASCPSNNLGLKVNTKGEDNGQQRESWSGDWHIPTPSPWGAHFAFDLSSLLGGLVWWLTGNYCPFSGTALPLCSVSHLSPTVSLGLCYSMCTQADKSPSYHGQQSPEGWHSIATRQRAFHSSYTLTHVHTHARNSHAPTPLEQLRAIWSSWASGFSPES